jgi:hypothetical protein
MPSLSAKLAPERIIEKTDPNRPNLALTRFITLPHEQKIQDPIFLILFLATFFGYTALSGYALYGWSQVDGLGGGLGPGNGGSSVTLNSCVLLLLTGVLADCEVDE